MSDFRRRLMMNAGDPLAISSSKAVAGDFAFYNKSLGKIVIIPYDLVNDNFNKDNYEPIGIVVVPGSHDIYKDGSCSIISLKLMCTKDPNNGTDYSIAANMVWGYNSITDFFENGKIPVCGTSSGGYGNKVIDFDYTANVYIPRQRNDGYGTQNKFDKKTYYYLDYATAGYMGLSPYNNDDTCNEEIFKVNTSDNPDNAFLNIDGKINTEQIIKSVTSQLTWKTDETIKNDADGNYPPACCCWRYYTKGTKQGDWYLPSLIELFYFYARYDDVINSIDKLNNYYGLSLITYGIQLSTSTKYNDRYIHSINVNYGIITTVNTFTESSTYKAYYRIK